MLDVCHCWTTTRYAFLALLELQCCLGQGGITAPSFSSLGSVFRG